MSALYSLHLSCHPLLDEGMGHIYILLFFSHQSHCLCTAKYQNQMYFVADMRMQACSSIHLRGSYHYPSLKKLGTASNNNIPNGV